MKKPKYIWKMTIVEWGDFALEEVRRSIGEELYARGYSWKFSEIAGSPRKMTLKIMLYGKKGSKSYSGALTALVDSDYHFGGRPREESLVAL
jgi:hypothetical protein